jgi:hypothetical protein
MGITLMQLVGVVLVGVFGLVSGTFFGNWWGEGPYLRTHTDLAGSAVSFAGVVLLIVLLGTGAVP